MLGQSLKGLLAHKLRLLTTALAVVLGVAFFAGTLVLTDTIQRSLNAAFSGGYGSTDGVVRARAQFQGANNSGEQRGRVPASLVSTVAGVHGVAVAEGEVYGYARLVGTDGTALGNPAGGAPTLGGNWTDTPQLNPYKIVAGNPPLADNEVVIDRKSAKDGNLAVGDTTTVLVQGPPQRVRIAGIVTFGSSDSPAGATVALFRTPVAQRLVAQPGTFDTIGLVAKDGVSQTQLVSEVQSVLPSGVEAVTGKQVVKESKDQAKASLTFFNTFMLVFAIVALLVGGFMTFNTFSITVAQRTRENGLLRALGASRRQVLGSVLVEASAIGVIASLVGLGLGVVVAAGLKALIAALGFPLPGGGVVFTVRTAALALVIGIGITVLSAFSPARKAAKVSPMRAMQAEFTGSTGYGSKERVIVGVVVLASGIGLLFAGLSGVGNAVTLTGIGMLLVFFGVSVLGRTIALPLSRFIGAPLPRLRGVAGEVARENAMRNPKRTAATASALMIGVGLVCFITVLATSTKTSINSTIDKAFTGDFVVNSGASQYQSGGLDPAIARQINGLPEVAAATGLRLAPVQLEGKAQQIVAVDTKTAYQIMDVKPLQGSTQLGAGEVAVYEKVAKDHGLRVGSVIPARFPSTGEKPLRVGLIYGENQPAGNYFISTAAYDANFPNPYDYQIYVKKAPTTSSAAALAAVKRTTSAYPGTEVLDQAGLKDQIAQPINQLLALVYALLLLAIIIALLGIGNTLALSIFERTREVGLLRAVGMTRPQLRSAIRWESVIIALQGTVLGLIIGVFFGWALVRALKDQGITTFSVPVGTLIVVVVLAAVAGVVAAILPSRRAAKLNVLRAIVSE
ncbi:MAG TPA: FtsX-like permease family protein [Frankiaceae bacterium]|nr:FtsX-like permease family protein [Frankiaceae bacterium]